MTNETKKQNALTEPSDIYFASIEAPSYRALGAALKTKGWVIDSVEQSAHYGTQGIVVDCNLAVDPATAERIEREGVLEAKLGHGVKVAIEMP